MSLFSTHLEQSITVRKQFEGDELGDEVFEHH